MSATTESTVRHDWYQTDNDVVVNVLKRGLTSDQCRIQFNPNRLVVGVIGKEGEEDTVIMAIELAGSIQPAKCSYKCTPSKIEIKMEKIHSGRWETLSSKNDLSSTALRPTKNWDRLEKEAVAEEEKAEMSLLKCRRYVPPEVSTLGRLQSVASIIMGDHYGFSLTTFSPSGKLLQIEYALNAVKNGQPSVGLKATDGVVLATENKSSVLVDNSCGNKVEQISPHIGCVYSGMGPDYRLLVKRARKIAVEYQLQYGEEIATTQLVTKLATVMQEYTQSGGVRPFGVSLLIAGWDSDPGKPILFQCDPSGAYFAWKTTAMGKNDVNAKTFLEKRYTDELELEDGIHTALLTLRESFDVGMTEENIQIGICNRDGFQLLSKQQIKDHLGVL